jgi:hypothetical protein
VRCMHCQIRCTEQQHHQQLLPVARTIGHNSADHISVDEHLFSSTYARSCGCNIRVSPPYSSSQGCVVCNYCSLIIINLCCSSAQQGVAWMLFDISGCFPSNDAICSASAMCSHAYTCASALVPRAAAVSLQVLREVPKV